MTEAVLNKEGYARLRSELSTTPSFVPTFAILALDAALLATSVSLLRSGGALAYVASQFLLAVVFFNSFSILHECGHGSASRHGWLNTLVGHYASTFCVIPYFPWKYIHQKHHAWTGNLERDPVLKSLRLWGNRGVPALVRLCWRTWIPLGALLQHVVYASYPYTMWKESELNGRKLVRCLASLAWFPIAYMILGRLVPELVRIQNVALAFVFFLVAEELVNIPHHVDMPNFQSKLPVWEQVRATRSCYYPPGLSELFVLNFNFHIEHHLFPSLPWYRLRRARTLVKQALGSHYTEVIGIGWNMENRSRDLQHIVDRRKASELREPVGS